MTVGGGLNQNFDGFVNHRSLGDADEQTVFEVGGVEGDERVVLVAGVARQVRFDGRVSTPSRISVTLTASISPT